MAKTQIALHVRDDVREYLKNFSSYGFKSRNQFIETAVLAYVRQLKEGTVNKEQDERTREIVQQELEQRFGHLMDGRTINGKALEVLVRNNPFQERVTEAVAKEIEAYVDALYEIDDSYAIFEEIKPTRVALTEALRIRGLLTEPEVDYDPETGEAVIVG